MRYLLTSLLLLSVLFVTAQDYQRLYGPIDGVNLNVIDAVQIENGSTYVVSSFITEDQENEGLLLTKHNLKGGIDWDTEILLDPGFEITRYGDMKVITGDSMLITFQAKTDTTFVQGVIRTGSRGDVEWGYSFYTNSDSTNTARPVELALRDTSTFIMAGTTVDSLEYTSLWQIDGEGNGPAMETQLTMTDTTSINIFEEGDFGSGEDIFFQEDPGIAPGYIYTAGPPQDGFYTISNNLGNWPELFDCWLPAQDNSNDPNGYMMVVNATVEPGIFYEEVVDNLSENTEYEFTADILNLISTECDLMDPNVAFLIDGVSQFETGPIVESNGWMTYGFSFTTAPGQTSVQLSLRNNAPGGEGNDLALDNITFRPSPEKYSYSLSEISYDDKDSTIYLSGKILADSTQLFVAKLDTAYQQIWARSYHLPQIGQGQIYEQLVTQDGGLVLVGSLRPGFYRGFVTKLDSLGEVQWFTTLNFNDPLSGGTYISGATLGAGGEIVVRGTYLENFAFSKPFIIAYDQGGTRLWEKQYNRNAVRQLDLTSGILQSDEYLTIIDQGNIIAASDGGYMSVSTAEELSAGTVTSRIKLNKTDEMGNSFILNEGEPSTCDSDINLVAATTPIVTDTLIITTEALMYEREDLAAIDTSLFVEFNVPIIPLQADVQCPDSINVTLNAQVQDAIWYEWSNGDTTATITVMDDEEYSVTVAFDEQTCFALCDTIVVPVFGPPEAQIALLNTELYCQEPRSFTLQAFPEGGDGNYSYMWSGGGETTPDVIRNDVNTTYSVTVTDGCGQDTVVTREILDTDFEQPDVASINIGCENGEFILQVVTTGDDFDASTIMWSEGTVGQTSITVTEPTTYSVTLTDDCLYDLSADIDLTDISNINLGFDGNSYCSDGIIFITATLSPIQFFDVADIVWSTGAQDNGNQVITVTEFGDYTVMITDECGNMLEQTINVPDLSQAPQDIDIIASCTSTGILYQVADPSVLNINTIQWTDELGNIVGSGTNITLDSPQSVVVNAVDNCQNLISDQISLDEVLQANMGELTLSTDTNACDIEMGELQEFTITAEFNGQSDVETYIWSTGDETPSIVVTEIGEYTVMIVDACGFEQNASVTISESDLFQDVTVQIEKSCSETGSTATAIINGPINEDFGYQWSNGNTGQTIPLPAVDTSTSNVLFVEVQNICDASRIDSIAVNVGDFFPCECVSWPNFMSLAGSVGGGTTEERDRTFGPVVNCPELITDYNLFIYNAYGNLVYETSATTASVENATDTTLSRIGTNWNGRNENDGDPLPTGVYMFYSTYVIDGETIEKKGELTLVR